MRPLDCDDAVPAACKTTNLVVTFDPLEGGGGGGPMLDPEVGGAGGGGILGPPCDLKLFF